QSSRRWKYLEIFSDVFERFVLRGGATARTVKEFIDAMELCDPVEEEDTTFEKVQLMTLHACKGLEFPVVILMGVEEDLIPHKTLGSDVSEERRLFYVGVTRAKKHLMLSRAKKRKRFGKWADCVASRFLLEVPE